MCVCWRWKTHAHLCVLSCDRVFGTPWTVACQAPLSNGFFKQEYCRGLPCPPPGDLPDLGIEAVSPALQADSLPLSHWVIPNPKSNSKIRPK